MSATSATAARWQAAGASGMSPPVLFVIDDDTGVMRALRDDLSRRFGGDFRVIGESWPAAGLAAPRRLADGHEPVALLIVDQDMSEMSGVDFLARAHEHCRVCAQACRRCERACRELLEAMKYREFLDAMK